MARALSLVLCCDANVIIARQCFEMPVRSADTLECIFRLIVGEVSRSTWTRIPARREQYSGLMVDTFGGVLE